MDYSWLTTSGSALLMVLFTTVAIYLTLIILTRVAGLRSFSKMSSFDFAITVAIGSVIASTILSDNPPLLQGMAGLAFLYLIQITVASLRGKSEYLSRLVDNPPLLLMDGSIFLEENMRKAKITHDDLRAKLREANVTQLKQVKAVVMEATGDVSVLHHSDPAHKIDNELLENVTGY